MVNYREILRMSSDPRNTQRSIAATVHKPGDAMQVDWAGNTLDIYDPLTGEASKAYYLWQKCSFYKGTRVAIHLRSHSVQRNPIVKEEHMPPEH